MLLNESLELENLDHTLFFLGSVMVSMWFVSRDSCVRDLVSSEVMWKVMEPLKGGA